MKNHKGLVRKNFMQNFGGFTLIEALLILAIIGLLGGTGWYVWNARNKTTDKNLNTAAQTEIKTSSKTAVIPEGYIQYENKEVGFSFAYPKEWGNLIFSKEENNRMNGNFIKNGQHGDYVVRLHKKDITPPAGTDSPTYNLFGYKEKNGSFVLLRVGGTEETIANKDILTLSTKANQGYLIYRSTGLGYYFGAFGKLANNSAYDSVIFDYLQGRQDQPFTQDDPSVQQMIKILETFQNI